MAANPLSEDVLEFGCRQTDDILEAKKGNTKYCASLFKAFFCYLRLIILVVFVSFASSIISSNFSDNQCDHETKCLSCDASSFNLDTNGLSQDMSKFANGNGCCFQLKDLHVLLVSKYFALVWLRV